MNHNPLTGIIVETVLHLRGRVVRQDKGEIYSRWESYMVKFNQQPLASLEFFLVTRRIKRRQQGNEP